MLRSFARVGSAGAALAVALGIAVMPPALGADTAPGPGAGARAPVIGAEQATAIPGRYIVVLRERTVNRSLPATAAEVARQAVTSGAQVTDRYQRVLNGFAAALPPRALQALRANPNVAYIEADQRVTTSAVQDGATWGLDRVDQRALPLNGRYRYDRSGAGVTAYVIDTGIRAGHREFRGRVAAGFTAVADGRGTADCNGHGTHVAGTLGGATYGVAKRVTLRPVRVLRCDGSGSNSKVIAGVDWVTAHHTGAAPAVANMSVGGGASTAMDDAVAASVADGVTYVVAAGNYSEDACFSSPARAVPALTVGATTRRDARAGFSNYGSCVDLFAPGAGITSAWHTSNRATSSLDGTSMASPHVAGAAALYLEAYPTASPEAVSNALLSGATTGVVTGRGPSSPNRLLHSRVATAPTTAPAVANHLANPGFESGPSGWTTSDGAVIDDSANAPARTGDWKAWLGGYGVQTTQSFSRTVAIPAASSATLSFHLYVASEEGAGTAYDTMTVDVVSGAGSTTVATFSNRDKGASYVLRRVNLSAYTGQTVTVRFEGREDASVITSFLLDDLALTTG